NCKGPMAKEAICIAVSVDWLVQGRSSNKILSEQFHEMSCFLPCLTFRSVRKFMYWAGFWKLMIPFWGKTEEDTRLSESCMLEIYARNFSFKGCPFKQTR
ncbi:hypothetical protein KI387_015395, partial [Taxus chinensis]